MNAICYRYGLYKIPEKTALWIAYRIPRWLVSWCLIRAWAHATEVGHGYSNTNAATVTMDEVIQRWNWKNLHSDGEQ